MAYRSTLALSSFLCLVACASAAPPEPVPAHLAPVARASTVPAPEPAACASLPAHPVVAVAGYGDRQVMVVGKRMEQGDSDRKFEVIDAHLLLTDGGRCLLSRVPLGEMTRPIPADEAGAATAKPPQLTIGAVGTIDGNIGSPVEIERATIGSSEVLLVYLMRDVKWGLTEFYVVPVTVRGNELVAGDRTQLGRDSMGPPVFYSKVRAQADGVLLERDGMGIEGLPQRIRLVPGERGALRARPEAGTPSER